MKELNTFGMDELTEQEMVNTEGGLFNTPGYITGLEMTILVGMCGVFGMAGFLHWMAYGYLPDGSIAGPALQTTYNSFMAS